MDSNVFEIDEDQDILIDFYEELTLKSEEIDNIIMSLIDEPTESAHFNDLLSLLNTLGGKAGNYNLAPVVEPVKTIEMLIDRIQSRKIAVTESFRTLIAQAFSLVLYIAQEASEKGEVSFSLFIEVQTALQPVATFEDNFDEAVSRSLAIIEGQSHKNDEDDGIDLFGDDDGIDLFGDEEEDVLFDAPAAADNDAAIAVEETPETASADLQTEKKAVINSEPTFNQSALIQRDLTFFRTLGGFSNKRRRGSLPRIDVILPIALGMNAMNIHPVDFFQLEAAVYLHDIALLRLNDESLQTSSAINSKEDQEHPLLAFEILSQMDCWEEASKIVYQHQERLNGSGFPEGLMGDQICDGAKIIAICDCFYSVAHEQNGERTKQSVIHAVSEVNSGEGTLYDAEWVKHFNQVVRIQHKIGAI